MSTVAAIDVGSNAMRLAIASITYNNQLNVIQTSREPVRLGQDVFDGGKISDKLLALAIDAFLRFRKQISRNNAMITRAVATSALREATNQTYFVNEIAKSTEIEIEVISAEEEARLIHLAVSNRLKLKDRVAVLLDIGGGSVTISLSKDRRIIASRSFPLGTVRLLNILEQKRGNEIVLNQLVDRYVANAYKTWKKEVGSQDIDVCIGTGGNLESLSELSAEGRSTGIEGRLTLDELDDIQDKLQELTYEERIEKLGLRPDRADVIIPATIVLKSILHHVRPKTIMIPHVGLKEGILLGLIPRISGEKERISWEQVISSSKQLAKKYDYDEQHSLTVAQFALQIFDSTKKLHNLNSDERVILESAAILHDIGQYVRITDYSKHSCYLINASPLIGLNVVQKSIVSNIVRYHVDSYPTTKHKLFQNLPPKYRLVVSKLAAILRLADALDEEHTRHVKKLHIIHRKSDLLIGLEGKGGLLLEKWALSQRSDLFESVFDTRVVVLNGN
jgi:exopolyphosphatase/guanosine-5'-triphosphate,3'-diphosphate pyrophosphatase